MAKAPHKWTITPNRKVIILDMLEKQHTLGTIATSYGITPKTLTKALKRAKIEPTDLKRKGMADIKAKMLQRLATIDRDDKYVEMSLKVLDKYGHILDEGETLTTAGSSKKLNADIQLKILAELSDD